MRRIVIGGFALGGILGAALMFGLTQVLDGGPSARTAPEIVRALRSSAGDYCPESNSTPSGSPAIVATLIAPIRGAGGDWYTGCTLDTVGPQGVGRGYICYRVRPDTLEVTSIHVTLRKACESAADWLK